MTDKASQPEDAVAGEIQSLLSESDWPALISEVEQHPDPVVAEALDDLPFSQCLTVLRRLDRATAVDIFDHLDTDTQIEIINTFRPQRAADFLEEMAPDERADLVSAMHAADVISLLKLLPEDEQEDIAELTSYDENTAGGRMTSEFVRVRGDMNVREALRTFRDEFSDVEMAYYFYVLDDEERLEGLVTMRELVAAPGDTLVGDIMRRNLYSVRPDLDQEEVADELALYEVIALPVTDTDNHMLGIVTFDDVIDVLEEEAVEDQEYFAGLTPTTEDGADHSLWRDIWQRLPWLIGFLVLGSLSGFLLSYFLTSFQSAEAILLFGVLVSLQPMLTGAAGNAGTQSVTLSIQAISLGERDWGAWRAVLTREICLGAALGACLAVVAYGRALLSGSHATYLAASVSLAIIVCVSLSTTLGALLPMIFKKLGLDPAVISSPLITTLMDLLSVAVYYLLALRLLPFFS